MHLQPQLENQNWVLFKNWKITTQICCYASTFILISSVSSFICSYMLLATTFTYFHQSFQHMFYQTSFNQVTNFVQLQKNLSRNYFNEKMDKILLMNTIFHFAQQESFSIWQPFECFDEPKLLGNINLTSSAFCGGHTNKEVPQSIGIDKEYFKKFTSLMTDVYMMYNLRQPFYTSLSDDAYFGIIDFIRKPSSAKPQSIHVRQWYQDHLNCMNTGKLIIQSSPYFSGDKVVSFALSTNLTSVNGTMIGVGAQNQDLRLIPTFSKNNIKFSMVNSQDQLIISPLYVMNQSEIYNITQKEITGISISQWEQWKLDIDKQKSYVVNTVDQTQISIIKLENPLSYIILEIDYTEDLNAQQYLFNRIINESNKLIELIIATFIGAISFVLGLQYISVRIMQKDIEDIMETTRLKVYTTYYFVNRNQVKVKTSNISFQLYQAYLKLNESLSDNKNKNEQCQIIEELEYPKQPSLKIQYIDDIYQYTQNLQNQHQSQYSQISLITKQLWQKFKIQRNPLRFRFRI